jgi:hypothetical protein
LRGFGESRQKEKKSVIDKKKWKWFRDDDGGIGEEGTTPYSQKTECECTGETRTKGDEFADIYSEKAFTNTMRQRQSRKEYRQEKSEWFTKKSVPGNWLDFPTEPPICGRNDGLSGELVGITFSKHRNESIKAYGNAIVPQVALQIFKAIEEYEKTP